MSDHVSFAARLETLRRGRSTYVVLRVADEVVAAMAGSRRVEGEIDDRPMNVALTRAAPVEGTFGYVGARLARALAASPGDLLEARSAPAAANEVGTPVGVAEALLAVEATPLWDALTPGRRRGLLHRIDVAQAAETRARHIARMISSLGPPP